MRILNYFAQFTICARCEKPFTVVSPDRIKCPYCNETDTTAFQALYSPTLKSLIEMLEHVHLQKEESWRNHGLLIIGLSIFEALLSETFQSYMDSKRLPWIFGRPIVRHLPWQEKFDFLVQGAHLEESSMSIKEKLREVYELRIQFLHGKASRLQADLDVMIYDMVGDLLRLFAEIYFQMDLKPYFLQQTKEEVRPLRRGSESHIAPLPKG